MARHLRPGGLYVDIGSGTGHNSVRMARAAVGLRARFVCVEPVSRPTPRVLRYMRKRTDGGMQFVRALGDRLPLRDGQVDGVSIFFVLHHIPYEIQQRVLDEVRRVLRPGGCLFLWEDTPEDEREFLVNETWDRRLNFEAKSEPHFYRSGDHWAALLTGQGFDQVERAYYEDNSKRRGEGLVRHTGFVMRYGNAGG